MSIVSGFLALLFIVLIPTVIGAGFTIKFESYAKSINENMNYSLKILRSFVWSWLYGQLLLWCVFQGIAVTVIMKSDRLDVIVLWFLIAQGVLVAVSLFVGKIRFNRFRNCEKLTYIESAGYEEKLKREVIAWTVFGIILLVQVILYVVLAYKEVDDSFYVAEALEATTADKLYMLIPFTGLHTEMDFRHSLEPFPIWIAYLSKMTGMHVATISHVILPIALLPMSYGVYYLIGEKLLARKTFMLPMYMILTEVIVMFGYYSTRTPEKFLLTRIRQGKTTLASMVIPCMILCFIMILENIRDAEKVDIRNYMMLFTITATGCLCSTLGAFLCSMFVGIAAVLISVMYKRWQHLLPMAVCCMPCIIVAVLYLIKR